jgi:two-component system cell cycle sensor histidine kinase/response regulator CckA
MMRGWLERLRGKPEAPGILSRIIACDPMAAALLHDAAGPALVMDAHGILVTGNAALAQMLAGTALLQPGTPVAALFQAALRDAASDEIALVLRGRAAAGRIFASALAGGHAGQDIRVTVLPLQDNASQVCGALLRFTDITPQRQLEAQLAHSQKLQATGQLAGGIAHDFNNLLTAILGAADGIVEREPLGETEEDARQILASARRGAALVRQLLAFGRQQTLQPRSLAVNAVIEDVSGLLKRLLGGKVRLVLALEQPGRMVRADPTQLDQVLINLAVNARDAMPEGGDLTLRSGHITVFRPLIQGAETIPPGRYVMIEVQDTGTGIRPDVLPRIFDPFFTTKRETGGSGLGLSTVHGIIRQSDGFLAVDSEPGRGTSMRIYLPRWDEAEAVAIPRLPKPQPPQPRSEAPACGQGVVLLVDDEDAVRHLAARALQRAGWQVLSADSGESALELLRERPPDAPILSALISDVVMPGIDGAALAQQVRGAYAAADVPVILVSGYAESPLRGGLQAHSTLFLAKPYSLADLVGTLAKATAPVI